MLDPDEDLTSIIVSGVADIEWPTGRELACNLFDNVFKRVVGKVARIKVDMKISL